MRGRWWCGRVPVILIVSLCLILYTGHDVLRYLSYHATAYDLGFFDQIASNLSAGRGWTSSFIGYDFRGQHWEPILLLWAQLDRLFASPIWLLVINSVALGLAPLAAWRLARCWLGTDSAAPPMAALATALSPLVLRTAGFDYHSEALTPLLALLALEAASRRRWLAVAACCGVLMLLKEDAFLVVAGIGWLIWRADGRRSGLLLSAAAIAGFVAVVGVYMPGIRHGQTGDLVARYAYLSADGHAAGPSEILAGMVVHPGTWLAHLTTAAPLQGLALALVPLAFLPLLSGWAALAPVPPLAVALLANDPTQSSLLLHYGAEVFPLLLACALLGWRRVEAWGLPQRVPAPRAAAALLVTGVIAAVPLTVDLGLRAREFSGLERHAAVQALIDRVPAGAGVAASSELVAHLSERADITEVPDIRGARWVIVDSERAPSLQALGAGYQATVDQLPGQFHVVASSAGVTLWERS
ncbi:MAG: DUF2079 domain-containing protein [Candidatus Dormibacteraeota bacterium]|uniref:DUF2079 domain-containing protein n=1 Tax=Candidatus Amunia macphersoniae TaxID=3127014 RepID=A0A934KQI7_9BACT|nr:DUF2079 domain-containing protein [Candidatus Dormibacteraeota bacterium]